MTAFEAGKHNVNVNFYLFYKGNRQAESLVEEKRSTRGKVSGQSLKIKL